MNGEHPWAEPAKVNLRCATSDAIIAWLSVSLSVYKLEVVHLLPVLWPTLGAFAYSIE